MHEKEKEHHSLPRKASERVSAVIRKDQAKLVKKVTFGQSKLRYSSSSALPRSGRVRYSADVEGSNWDSRDGAPKCRRVARGIYSFDSASLEMDELATAIPRCSDADCHSCCYRRGYLDGRVVQVVEAGAVDRT